MNDYFDEVFDKIMKAPFVEKFSDDRYAQSFYAALCNNDLTDKDGNDFGMSWRSSGGFVADIRNTMFGTSEDYLDFYCSGMGHDGAAREGDVTEEVRRDMESIGYAFKPVD